MSDWQPPETRRGDLVEVLHGVEVADPYRWLEDIDSAEVADWVARQNIVTSEWLAAQAPSRDEIRARLEELTDLTTWSAAVQRGGRWFGLRKDPHADQPVLVVSDDPSEFGRVLLDPADWDDAGEGAVTATISGWEPSPDGRLVAWARSDAGSDWMTWRVRDVFTGEDRPDVLRWSKFCNATWLASNDGFVYSALDRPAADEDPTKVTVETPRITLHQLGNEQRADATLHRESDGELIPHAEISHDGRWLILTVSRGTLRETVVRAIDLTDIAALPIDVVAEANALHQVVGTQGDVFFVLTDDTAPMGRLVAIDAADPDRRRRELIPEGPDRIEAIVRAQDAFVVHVFRDAASALRVHGPDGAARHDVALPASSAITELRANPESRLVTLTLTSFTDPGSAWILDTATGELTQLHEPGLKTPDLVVDRVHASSADGTQVPMFLVHRADVTADGSVPALLYGYGGFDIAITPTWKADWQVWVERGGLLAVANLRGGGEFGRAWYDAGRRDRKQNVFDDALGCARWLASSGWSRPGRIAVTGRSNGGLLAAACLTQGPDLFGAAVPEVGVLDMVRFHKFTIGWAWISDFGDPDDPEGFGWVRGYSPLHRIEPGRVYPPTLVTTGDHDDRVMPAHSYKFAAALQSAAAGDGPVLLRIDTAAGHGAGKPTSKLLDERADVLAFLEATLT